ncbi:DUF805 domain-containing protein [Desulfovibrio oxamicus]|uniref:DUF805 domain-containing protein n=1 Tax=Nitratidesulfovibrio oxamicus TaxID=32016 RepID=A0ABS0J311_9BACT|nr:DUF805 domain-containing protein [Nitratidesulfovibrio oxamicus]MBG3876825.1 DUF805 domain-containing protein [Nitratidesulfovibrio oxamicus]
MAVLFSLCALCLLIWLVFFRRQAASDQEIMSVVVALRAHLLPLAETEGDTADNLVNLDLSRYRSGTVALAQPLPSLDILDFFDQTGTTDLARDALRDMHMGRLLNLLLFYALARGHIKGVHTNRYDRALFDLLARHGLLTPDNHTLLHDKVILTAVLSFFHPRGDRRYLIPWIAQHHAEDFHQALHLRNAELLAAIIERFDARPLLPMDRYNRKEARRTYDRRILYNLPPEHLRNGKPTGFWLLALEPVRLFYMGHGRARRKEYWGFTLIAILCSVATGVADALLQLHMSNFISILWVLPSIGLGFRRMHDIGRNGGWMFVPVVNLVMACIPGLPEANMYGPNPKA